MPEQTVDTIQNDYQSVLAQFRKKYPGGVILSDLRIGTATELIAAVSLNDPGAGYLAAHAIACTPEASETASKKTVIGAMELIGIVPGGVSEAPALSFTTAAPADAVADAAPVKRARAKKDAEAAPPAPVEEAAPAVQLVDESAVAAEALEKERKGTISRMESVMSSMQKPELDAWAQYIVPRLQVPATKEGVSWDNWPMDKVIVFNNLLVAASIAAGIGDPYFPQDIDPDFAKYVTVKAEDPAPNPAAAADAPDPETDAFNEKMQAQYNVTAMLKHVAMHNTGLYAQVTSTMRNKLGSDEPSKLTLEQLQATTNMIQKQIDAGKVPPMPATDGADDDGDLDL